jgi:orotate phosphoribosyltransferase
MARIASGDDTIFSAARQRNSDAAEARNLHRSCAAAGHPVRSRAKLMNAEYRAELIQLLARESYFERELKLDSGRSSSFYIDCKRTLYIPRGAFLAGELMLELVTANGIEQVGGMAVGAIPLTDAIIAAAFRHGVNLRGFFVRKDIKAHGTQQKIEGAFRTDLATAAVDDTITTGGSTLDAIAAIRAAGGRVAAAFALVDRNESAREAFSREGIRYAWVFTAEEVRAAARPA